METAPAGQKEKPHLCRGHREPSGTAMSRPAGTPGGEWRAKPEFCGTPRPSYLAPTATRSTRENRRILSQERKNLNQISDGKNDTDNPLAASVPCENGMTRKVREKAEMPRVKQSHRKPRVGGSLKDHLAPTPLPRARPYHVMYQSVQILNI